MWPESCSSALISYQIQAPNQWACLWNLLSSETVTRQSSWAWVQDCVSTEKNWHQSVRHPTHKHTATIMKIKWRKARGGVGEKGNKEEEEQTSRDGLSLSDKLCVQLVIKLWGYFSPSVSLPQAVQTAACLSHCYRSSPSALPVFTFKLLCRWASATALRSNEAALCRYKYHFNLLRIRAWMAVCVGEREAANRAWITDEQYKCLHKLRSSQAKFRCKSNTVCTSILTCYGATWTLRRNNTVINNEIIHSACHFSCLSWNTCRCFIVKVSEEEIKFCPLNMLLLGWMAGNDPLCIKPNSQLKLCRFGF